jgi:hypothetical protein
MAWELLPVDYTDAVWSGLKRYSQIDNEDGTISLQDVTVYTNKEKSFFGAIQANRMNEALNTIMSMVENGTDLYEAFQNYFDGQKQLFEGRETDEFNSFVAYTDNLKADGDAIIATIETDYRGEIEYFEAIQEQVFAAWFQFMKDQLSQDAAGNLQNQCTELDERMSLLEHMAIQNDFSAPILATDSGDTPILLVDDLGFAIMADWKYKEE